MLIVVLANMSLSHAHPHLPLAQRQVDMRSVSIRPSLASISLRAVNHPHVLQTPTAPPHMDKLHSTLTHKHTQPPRSNICCSHTAWIVGKCCKDTHTGPPTSVNWDQCPPDSRLLLNYIIPSADTQSAVQGSCRWQFASPRSLTETERRRGGWRQMAVRVQVVYRLYFLLTLWRSFWRSPARGVKYTCNCELWGSYVVQHQKE